MTKSTHSKIKNTGILFELLTRQITADTMKGVKNSPALKITQSFFGPKKALTRELVLYQTLVNESFNTEVKAESLVSTTIRLRRKLDAKLLSEDKYKLIKEIKKHYELKDFFNSTVNNYSLYASIYRVFEGATISQAADVVRSRGTIVEHIYKKKKTATREVASQYLKEDVEIRLLAQKLMMDKFNDKYAGLSDKQQKVLQEYINNISNTTDLRNFVIQESRELRDVLKKQTNKVKDKTTKIKLAEVISLLDKNCNIKKVKEDNVHSLLLYHELVKELTNA
tara:strand:- start:326 stop:1168 length:843 start_codon:yes stop_codon:yes gene_type:complete